MLPFETLSDEENRKQYDEMNYYDSTAKEDLSSSNPPQTEHFGRSPTPVVARPTTMIHIKQIPQSYLW